MSSESPSPGKTVSVCLTGEVCLMSPFWEGGWTVILWTHLAPWSILRMGSLCVDVCYTSQERCWMVAEPEGGAGERLLRIQRSGWIFSNTAYPGWRSLLILVRGRDHLGKVTAEKHVFMGCAISWAQMLPCITRAICWEYPLVWGCMDSKISERT